MTSVASFAGSALSAVLFDFGGTLDSDGLTWVDRYLLLCAAQGLNSPRESLIRAFYDTDDALATRHALPGLGLAETLSLHSRDFVAQVQPGRSGNAAAAERLAAAFLNDAREHFRRNRPFLERLKQSYRLGIVSNFYGNLDSVLASEGLRGLFDVVADSTVLGVSKPDPGIFLHAARALGAAPEQCLMVGDSLRRDMRGAEALGMPHAHLRAGAGEVCCSRALALAKLTDLETVIAAEAAA